MSIEDTRLGLHVFKEYVYLIKQFPLTLTDNLYFIINDFNCCIIVYRV
jgi:hypothetical protein